MINIKEIDLGSSILSISIGLGFLAFSVLIIRIILIIINYIAERYKLNNINNKEQISLNKKVKGFNNK